MCSEDHSVWAEQARLDWSKHWLKWSVDLIVKHSTEEEQETLPYISNENIESWTGKLLIEDPQPLEADSRKFKINDVLFNKLRPYLAKVYHASFNGVSSSELLCLRPSQDLDSRFLFYVLSSKDFIDTVNAHSYGAKMPRADWEIVGHQSLPFPPLDTQRRIAEYLVDLIVKHSTEEEQETLPYISNENIESWTGKLLIEDPQPLEADSRKFKILSLIHI